MSTFSAEERDKLMVLFTVEQKDYVASFLKRGKRTAFANVMAKEKWVLSER